MSKYISATQLRHAMLSIAPFHVFYGTTFLVLKKNDAPVGSTMHISLDAENREHLKKYFRPHPKSDYFFTPFKVKKNEGRWRDPKYASTSLQAINTQGFAAALLHEKNEKIWGLDNNYLTFLSSKLPKGKKIPLLEFSCWFSKEEFFASDAKPREVADRFVKKFNLSVQELDELFEDNRDNLLSDENFFSTSEADWEEIVEEYGVPSDVPPETGAILHFLEFSGLGPVKKMKIEPGNRFNIVTGDNGLGKSFLLDVVWWALTQEWADHMIVPIEPVATPPQIKFSVGSRLSSPVIAEFQPKNYKWKVPNLSSKSGLVIYGRVDGSFVVWDPAHSEMDDSKDKFYNFTRDSVWTGDDKTEGLLRDWVRWQTRADEFPAFETFQKVIQRLKPPDWGGLSIGKPQRVRGWGMEIPTLIHPYGSVPVVYESAGIRRILTLTYLIVWAWEEHKIQAKSSGRREERQMVILLDEAEAHLHPRWQRVLLRALLGISQDLHEELSIQYFIASHSPLVLASAEPIWDINTDKLFHLNMDNTGRVSFEEVGFEIRGSVNSWLESPSFDGLHPGSESAEFALSKARNLLNSKQVSKRELEETSKLLANHIAADDPFWMRWIVFAVQNGVDL